MGWIDAELSLTLVTDPEMAELAGRFGRERKPTDVLSFPLAEGPGADYRGAQLGDVVISLDTAARQAAQRGTTLESELRDLMIHGCLHILGMDHERDADARRMHALEAHLRWEIARSTLRGRVGL